MFPFCLYPILLSFPAIVPLNSMGSKKIIKSWTYQAFANDDLERMKALISSTYIFENVEDCNIGSVAIVNDENIRCLALFEREKEKLILWNIVVAYDEYQFGTTLMCKIHEILKTKLCLHKSIDWRWKIAYFYNLKSYDYN